MYITVSYFSYQRTQWKIQKTGKKTKEGRVNEFKSLKNAEGTQRIAGGDEQRGRMLTGFFYRLTLPHPLPLPPFSPAWLCQKQKGRGWFGWCGTLQNMCQYQTNRIPSFYVLPRFHTFRNFP